MFRNVLCRLLTVSLLVSATYTVLNGQAPPPPKPPDLPTVPTIKANVKQVLVPFVVTDKHGHPVSGLQQSDFSIYEDDVEQNIIAFSKTYDPSLEQSTLPVAANVAGPSKTVSIKRAPPNSPTRTYLVCVDTLHSNVSNMIQARRALSKFFQGEHDDSAQYALMNLSRHIEVIQDSTRDSSLVLAALQSKRFQSSLLDSEASTIALESEGLRRMLKRFDPNVCDTSATRVRGTILDDCSEAKRVVESYIFSRAERTAILTRAFIQQLKAIIGAMAVMPTERTLILISDGFNLVPGRELYGVASAYFPDVGEFRLSGRDSQTELNSLLRLAQKSNVVVYGLDSRGLYTPASTGLGDASTEGYGDGAHTRVLSQMMTNEDTIAWENGSAMAQLASATGGLYFENNNNLLAGIRRAFDDERERYLLAYRSSKDSLDGTYRKIRVTVKNRELRVRAKSGYWATPN